MWHSSRLVGHSEVNPEAGFAEISGAVLEPDLNEAGRAADAAREVNGAVVACWLR